MKIYFSMRFYRRLIALMPAFLATIVFAAFLEYIVTPYETWFASLIIPSFFVSSTFHTVAWLIVYFAIAISFSGSIVEKNKKIILLWGIFYLLSLACCAMLFCAKWLPGTMLLTAVSTGLLTAITVLDKKNSLFTAVATAWFVYLTGLSVALTLIN